MEGLLPFQQTRASQPAATRPFKCDFLSLPRVTGEQETKDVKLKSAGCWPQAAETRKKGVSSVSPGSRVFPRIGKC